MCAFVSTDEAGDDAMPSRENLVRVDLEAEPSRQSAASRFSRSVKQPAATRATTRIARSAPTKSAYAFDHTAKASASAVPMVSCGRTALIS